MKRTIQATAAAIVLAFAVSAASAGDFRISVGYDSCGTPRYYRPRTSTCVDRAPVYRTTYTSGGYYYPSSYDIYGGRSVYRSYGSTCGPRYYPSHSRRVVHSYGGGTHVRSYPRSSHRRSITVYGDHGVRFNRSVGHHRRGSVIRTTRSPQFHRRSTTFYRR